MAENKGPWQDIQPLELAGWLWLGEMGGALSCTLFPNEM